MKFKYQKFTIGPSGKPLVARPYIPIFLIGKTARTESPWYALLDSGADRIIFPAELAEVAGINNYKKGKHEPTMGIGKQGVDVYYHPLRVQVLGEDRELSCEVGFAENFSVPLLGRTFFEHYKSVVFNETKGEVELKP